MTPAANDHDELLRETIARHFPDAKIGDDGEIALGFGDLRMSCRVHAVRPLGAHSTAHLFFQLRSSRLGAFPVFASVSGYGESPQVAIVGGACNWACAFGPVLRAGVGGEEHPDVHRFEVTLDGQRFSVFVDALDRALSFGDPNVNDRFVAARARFAPESWLARAVLSSGRLPLLAGDRPTVLSLFVSDATEKRVVEVKIDGVDWPGLEPVFASVAAEPAGAITMLRELAVVVPIGPAPPLQREPILRTLRALAADTQRMSVDWPGWTQHGGQLAEPLAPEAIAELEAQVGALPADYRDFLATVGASGAGPGYGLLAPTDAAQLALAGGEFAWRDGEEPSPGTTGALALAHAGCGVMWLLVVAGPHRGEIWVDARSSDGLARRVATSFTAWYREWMSTAVRDGVPWLQWEARCCATANVFSQLITSIQREGTTPPEAMAAELGKRLKPGCISLASGGSPYFVAKTPLNPCQGCVAIAANFGLSPILFQPGQEPFLAQAPVDAPGSAKRGLWARFTDKIRPRS